MFSIRQTVVLPHVRGQGRSRCADPARHTWAQYTADLVALLDHLGVDRAVVGGTGLGSTITLRTALAHPDRIRAGILIGRCWSETAGQDGAAGPGAR
ncbi:alpha/beta fold hydrolase [Streptomyces sp. NPDC001858]